MLLLIYLLQI